MRGQVVLDDITGNLVPHDFNLGTLKTTRKLMTLVEILGCGVSQDAALSCHSTFMAVTTVGESNTNLVYIVHLVENRYYLLKRTVEPCTALRFHPYQENILFLATDSRSVYRIDVIDGTVIKMEGHRIPVVGIQSGSRSPLVITYNHEEVLLWSWPSLSLMSRLRLDEAVPVMWAGHVWQRDELIVSFVTGTVFIWHSQNRSQQHTVQPPDGLQIKFESFALS
ncbi:hypothetical protein SK128_019957, partial [Halocaridina rubra]